MWVTRRNRISSKGIKWAANTGWDFYVSLRRLNDSKMNLVCQLGILLDGREWHFISDEELYVLTTRTGHRSKYPGILSFLTCQSPPPPHSHPTPHPHSHEDIFWSSDRSDWFKFTRLSRRTGWTRLILGIKWSISINTYFIDGWIAMCSEALLVNVFRMHQHCGANELFKPLKTDTSQQPRGVKCKECLPREKNLPFLAAPSTSTFSQHPPRSASSFSETM